MNRSLKKWLLQNNLIIILFFCFGLKGQTFQNLVPNGSFETYTQCPTSTTKIHYAPPWIGPTTDETGYLNACSQNWNVPYYGGSYGYLEAKQGVAYAQLMVYHSINGQDYRNYAQIELIDSLSSGNCYFVQFFASNLQWTKYRVNNISACFTSFPLPTNVVSPGIIPNVQPHIINYNNPVLEDTANWIPISGVYSAIGGERYLSIGNFKNNVNTDTVNIYLPGSYPYSTLPPATSIFIDAISVYSLNPNGALPWSYRDTSVFIGDSVYIGNKMGGIGFHPQWFDINGNYISTNAGIYIKPTATSSFVVNYTVCSVSRADTVVVTVNPNVGKNELFYYEADIKLFPNPAIDLLEIKIDVSSEIGLKIENLEIKIFNGLGQKVLDEKIAFKDGKASVRTTDLLSGVYFLRLSTSEGSVIRKIIISR